MKKTLNEKVDEALLLWFNQIRSKGIPLSGQILKEKALFFNEKLGGLKDFKASSGWLYGWQNRHGVKEVSIQGEKMSSIGANEIDKCTKNFKMFVENHGFTREQVFNADETGLNYKALPKKTLDFCVNSYAPGWKMQKQRITLMDLVAQENIDLADYWNNYNIKNAIDNVADSWSELSSTTLEKCWNKLWPNTESPSNNSDDVSQADVVTSTSSTLPLENSETINEWLNCDENDCGYELLTDEQIINEVNDEEENNDDYDGTNNNNENGHNPTASFLKQEAKIATSNLEKFIAWYEMQDEAGVADTIRLRQFLLFAKNKTQVTLKERTLTEFFLKTN
ncbi:jerky protein homolog-like [Anastrepha obliqua]|uniref:jerky protein homolog-like n=1 Tax=Anastrepha obliqua TaxID=95512 RepID=UPI00240A4098|nr:jerky protein homolog-like [Anastrepha obliqua]